MIICLAVSVINVILDDEMILLQLGVEVYRW